MDLLLIISILVSVSAAFSYINARILKLQPAIGLMLISLLSSLLVLALSRVNTAFYSSIRQIIESVNFSDALLNVMLGFLLFAGALHIDLDALLKQKWAVLAFSTLSVALSTFLFGFLIHLVFMIFGISIDFIHCLWFGALVSPTDPIAVIGILRKSGMPEEIGVTINSESLFNDGVGVVLFVTIGQILSQGIENLSGADMIVLFCREALGGIALGLLIGYMAYFLIRRIDHYQTEILISLALVMICGELAHYLHVSGPLAVIIIGLMLGNKVSRTAMSRRTRDYHEKFWELVDHFLNAILFALIGLQMVILPFVFNYIWIGFIAIIILLICRYISLSIPIIFLKNKKLFNSKTALLMTWGGLRGGLSIALTLALPDSDYKEIIVSITYIIVIFSILVQGLSTGRLSSRMYPVTGER
jgi:CPA1 family monovalent cation:H+ antiporter